MTEITTFEQKILYFGLIFMSVTGVFVGLYTLQPIETPAPDVSSSQGVSVSVIAPAWITNLIDIPQPFVDLTIVIGVFLAPIMIMLSIIGIRYIKDLATQWV